MPETKVVYAEHLGRRVRVGSTQDQAISSYQKIRDAIQERRWDNAAQLANYFVDETTVCFTLYRQWIADLLAFLRDGGVPVADVAAADAQVVGKLALPDGRPYDRFRQWDEFRGQVEAFVGLAYREQEVAALHALDEFKETWRQLHDRDVDHTYGLMHEVKTRFGERSIGDMYDKLLVPLFVWRYEKFDIDKNLWSEALEMLVLVCLEAARSHLFGPERRGDIEVVETEDRYIMRFDPCGSGGRTVRGDEIEGTPPRMQAPYNWSVSEEPHSWNHFQKGVCLYCSHCIRLMEEMPIDRFGYPVRVVDPPIYDAEHPEKALRCQYQMFKDPTKIPEEYYRRVGRTKPTQFGSGAMGAPPLPDTTAGLPGAG
jgi:hypothetical protein